MQLLKKHYFKQIIDPQYNTKFKYLEAEINYTIIHFDDGTKRKVAYTLGQFEKLFTTNTTFQRIHKSYMVNMDYVKDIKIASSIFELKCGKELPISRRKKQKFR